MGCDGGTIPRRDELVRVRQKPEQKDKESVLQSKWRLCNITQQRLQEPIAMCGLGRLYSKQNVIEYLLEKEKMPESASHIKSIKDVRNLQLTPNPVYKDADKTEGSLDVRSAPYICKLIGLEMTGKFRFVALWTCGCVFSERALKEIKFKTCSLCQTPYTDEDVVILNGTDEEVELMRSKMEVRAARQKAAKKDKKSKKQATATILSAQTEQQAVATTSSKSEFLPSKLNVTSKSWCLCDERQHWS
ncbi:Replication termination factor 2, partial [Pseudolycoriella hygida]